MNDAMRRVRVVLMACAIASQIGWYVPPAYAELSPPRGAVDSRVRTAAYDGDEVYRLRGFVGYQIDLEFAADETFVGLGAGDLEGLAYVGEGNHLFLKPKALKVATNLTVLTTRRHYQFDYAVLPDRARSADVNVMYVLRFTYPEAAGESTLGEAKRLIDADLKRGPALRALNGDYWYCGGPALRPVAASDDGVHTRLRFAANAELPAIFVRNDDDSESLLNYSMDGGDVLIHRVARRFVLRRGNLLGCVVNKGFVGGGIRLESGTVTPAVERQVQGSAP